MLLHHLLKNTSVILGSQSPRRRELLAALLIDFDVEVKSTDESFDPALPPQAIAEQIALKKLQGFDYYKYFDQLIITADTIVYTEDQQTLGKPRNREEAIATLKSLSGRSHQVYTAVAFAFKGRKNWFAEKTSVTFEVLSEEMISFYVDFQQPYDKAGAYGIQEWIGRVAVKSMDGTYENVMGLPTARLNKELLKFLSQSDI